VQPGYMEQARSLGPYPVPASRFLQAQGSASLSPRFPIWKGHGPDQRAAVFQPYKEAPPQRSSST